MKYYFASFILSVVFIYTGIFASEPANAPISGGFVQKTIVFPFQVHLSIKSDVYNATIITDAHSNVLVQMADYLTQETSVCGGTIVTEQYVITAAHCLVNFYGDSFFFHIAKEIKLAVGAVHEDNAEIDKAKVLGYKLHPNYNPTKLFCDIAIIKVENNKIFNQGPPIYLPISEIIEFNLLSGKQIIIEGVNDEIFGETRYSYHTVFGLHNKTSPVEVILGHSFQHVLDNDDCKKKIPFGYEIRSFHICTENINKGISNICDGEAGSPLFIASKRPEDGKYKYTLVGVSSFRTPACGSISIFSRVTSFMPFIVNCLTHPFKYFEEFIPFFKHVKWQL